jgi:beta-glucosidase
MKPIPKILISSLFLSVLVSCGPKWIETESNGIKTVINEGGKKLGYSSTSGVTILTADRLGFKDLNKNGQLDIYEDWRLSTDVRAKELASKMSIEQIAGLMLYSGHQSIPAGSRGFFAATYNGKAFEESGAVATDLTDQQKEFLSKDNLRHVLLTSVQSPEVAAGWNNNAQAFVEGLGLGIPANNSSDPRHGTIANAEYNAGAGGRISMWPGSLGLAATFDPALVEKFGSMGGKEYRALGLTTALSPQVDIATDPRWYRTSGTFGEDPYLSADIGRAYIDGFQTSTGDKEIADGWGYESVNAMVKHWPGGGSGEAGRDAHYGVESMPSILEIILHAHLIPFTEGAFKLKGKTGMPLRL